MSLNNMTVKELREIAKQMGIKGQFLAARKADLIVYMQDLIEVDHLAALDISSEMDEQSAMNEAEAERIASGVQFTKNGVIYGSGWNCCQKNPAKVVVFDNGVKWAVCKSCASVYSGEVQDIPIVKSQAKPMNTSVRLMNYAAQMGGVRGITFKQMKRITKKANRVLKMNGTFNTYPHLMTPSGRRKAGLESLV